MKSFLFGFGLLGLLYVTAPSLAQANDNQDVSGLEFESLSGNGLQRIADYRGQWLILNYWATWCKPCIKEMPELDKLHQADNQVRVLGLNFENADDARLKMFLDKHQVSYPMVRVDVYEPPAQLGSPRGLPTTFIVDPQGQLREVIVGPTDAKDLSTRVDGYRAAPQQDSESS